MKILIAADMEGITGVVHWDHVDEKNKEYGRFRKLMTADVNAAIRGAFDGGASEVVVADGHGTARNILVEEIDARAQLNSGSPSPLAMVQGAQTGIDAAIFVGYHARVGTENGILDHTWSGAVANLWLNDRIVGEIGVNAAVCGHFGAPVIMISGDQSACAEARELLGPIETVEVKQATGRMAAECRPPEVTQADIYETARRAVSRFASGQAVAPFLSQPPVKMAVELVTSEMADKAMLIPGARRTAAKTVEITAGDMPTAYRAMRAAVSLARA
jgi:D-amino peptidase